MVEGRKVLQTKNKLFPRVEVKEKPKGVEQQLHCSRRTKHVLLSEAHLILGTGYGDIVEMIKNESCNSCRGGKGRDHA